MSHSIPGRLAAFAATVGMLVPYPSYAAAPASESAAPRATFADAATVTDVALGEGGVLVGQVVAATGRPAAFTTIQLKTGGRTVAETQSDAEGRFGLQGLRGGAYQLRAGNGFRNLRLWTVGSAPPSARPAVLLAESPQPIARGQMGGPGPVGELLSHPLILGGLIATAIAVPIAVHNHHSDSKIITE